MPPGAGRPFCSSVHLCWTPVASTVLTCRRWPSLGGGPLVRVSSLRLVSGRAVSVTDTQMAQMAERLGSRAVNQKVAGSIPAVHWADTRE